MDEGIEVVRNFISELQVGDVPTAASRLHEDVIWHQPGRTKLSGTHSGKSVVLKLLAAFSANHIGIEFQEAYWCDNEVLCRILIRHRIGDRNEFQLISLNEGKISRIRHHGDTGYLSEIMRSQQAD